MPILVTLTDRVDARAIYLSGVALMVASHLGFAAFADGLWGAAAVRALAGMGLAGTYMTGLKLLADRVEPALMSRAVAGHAASIGIAGSISSCSRHERPVARMAGRLRGVRGRGDDWVADRVRLGAGSGAPPGHRGRGGILRLPAGAPQPLGDGLRGRLLRAYVGDECPARLGGRFSGLRRGRDGGGSPWIGPTVVATTMGFVGTWASVVGNELSSVWGGPDWCAWR